MKSTIRAAAIQMVSSPDCAENLETAERLIAEAASSRAEFVSLPEYFCQLSSDASAKLRIAEDKGAGPIQDMLGSAARRHGIWLVGGSIPLKTADPKRVTNTTLMFGPDGECVARYDKCNLFSISSAEVTHDENLTMIGGDELVAVNLPWGRVGLGICYDVRFPRFFERLGEVDVVVLPSAFTFPTGAAHWELLIRTRAVDNQCFLLASAQGGLHKSGRRTWGHTMAVDPWGRVLGTIDEGEGVLTVDIDLSEVGRVRSTLPVVRDRAINDNLKGVKSDA
ncbi:carbon-nitrogen hydrolase family protein [Paraburkholderia susongensis]|uniref:Nitrilase n=1 Tax=Paraburkholderia susongensis TaxID=1515439 RepID=A0A1X7K0Z4_9BURK|nr:carbon-nitrogen hydrolase family protein [Paraburkholderia susongensis]SMG34156.1 nitrilase [Paraburkholderia susongensis]